MPTKKKTIYWQKELEKATGEIEKKIKKVFSDYDKKVFSGKPLPLSERQSLWKNKYQPKLDALMKKEESAYKKLYYKYHNKDYKPKACYEIIF